MPPTNDDVANAIAFIGPNGQSFSGNTDSGSTQVNEDITDGAKQVQESVWYSYTPSMTGTVDFTATAQDLISNSITVQVFDGGIDTAHQVAEGQDSGGPGNQAVSFNALANHTYLLQVGHEPITPGDPGDPGDPGGPGGPGGPNSSTNFDLSFNNGPDAVEPACYLRGTLILTDAGETPVEALAIGDLVVTGSGALQPVKWIGRRSYAAAFAQSDTVRPVCVSAGALGDNLPRRDLWLSPCHALLIDHMLIEARFIVNGATITQPPVSQTFEYFHIELDSHDVVLAEGVPAETWLDRHTRRRFANAAEFDTLYPEHRPDPLARDYAFRPLNGFRLEGVRRRFVAAAAA